MLLVKLANREGKMVKMNPVFSFGYLFLGPIYLFIRCKIIRGLLFLLLYLAVCFKGLPLIIKDLLISFGVSMDLSFLDKIDELYLPILGVLLALHICLCFVFAGTIIKGYCKKGYYPYSEVDAQILVKYNIANVGIKSYLASFGPIQGVKGKIKVGNDPKIKKELDELKNLLREGTISKDEYNKKRAQIFMGVNK